MAEPDLDILYPGVAGGDSRRPRGRARKSRPAVPPRARHPSPRKRSQLKGARCARVLRMAQAPPLTRTTIFHGNPGAYRGGRGEVRGRVHKSSGSRQPPAVLADKPLQRCLIGRLLAVTKEQRPENTDDEFEEPIDLNEAEQEDLLEAESAPQQVTYSGQDFDVEGLVRRLNKQDRQRDRNSATRTSE